MIDKMIATLEANCPRVPGTYALELDNTRLVVASGKVTRSEEETDVTIKVSESVLVEAVANPQSLLLAYVEGELDISGDTELVANVPIVIGAVL